ncbi:uncharacterized protein BDFB_009339 [Asbolus verrucosus]|uniref:Odorant receptor n=1 Tax=Asbolus verrucosus TaxID=1661398 RepID=A0A482WEL2_ASBVE|nr:uncharacterized protein BDFB_009339 [Asbolus verrucosus]
MGADTLHLLDLRDFIKLNVNCMEFFGYFCPEYEKTYKKICYYIYAVVFVGFIFILRILSEFVNMIVVFGDIEKMTEASFVLLTHLVEALKLYYFVKNRSSVRNLINSVNRKEFKPRNWDQYRMLSDDIKMSRMITKVFLFMCCITCCLWGVFPFFDKNPDGTIRLPLSGWFPFSTEESPVFECVYAYQTIGVLITGLSNISMDTFLSGTIMIISGQLSILNNSFQIMRQKCASNSGKIKEAHAEVKKKLVRNIVHFQSIIEFADDVTSLFTLCIMAQFVVSVIIICITMFQMSLVSVFSLQFLSMVLYQACMLLEIFLWCYYGNEVILKSEQLTESAYVCEWVDCSKEFRKNLLFFMTRSQIPLKLYAGGYFSLSLDTFMAE